MSMTQEARKWHEVYEEMTPMQKKIGSQSLTRALPLSSY
jgi:hypothetical protein